MKTIIIICAVLLASLASGCAENKKESSSVSETSKNATTTAISAEKNDSSELVKPETTTLTEQVISDKASEYEDSSSRDSIYDHKEGSLSSVEDLDLHDIDGNNTNFEFTYEGETYNAQYTPDNWKIIDSYKIRNSADMLLICQALIDINPLHGKDMVSYRVPDDMVDEWMQHNLAYDIFEDNELLRARAKDVDLNPEDQGKNIIEKYMEIADLL